jgi:hypothetical protein
MSANRIARANILRFCVFLVWFLDLVIIVVCLGLAGFGKGPPYIEPGEMLKSATLLLGLITPAFGATTIFYLRYDPLRTAIFSRSFELFTITIMCSLLYHVLLNTMVYFGVYKMQIVPGGTGSQLYNNCAVIVNWMGIFSFLLGPAAWLMSKDDAVPVESQPIPPAVVTVSETATIGS